MALGRVRRGYVTVDVDVDISDVLSEIENDVLLDECRSRNILHQVESKPKLDEEPDCPRAQAEEAISLLRCGRTSDALTLLERSLFPKFKTVTDCEVALAKLRASV